MVSGFPCQFSVTLLEGALAQFIVSYLPLLGSLNCFLVSIIRFKVSLKLLMVFWFPLHGLGFPLPILRNMVGRSSTVCWFP